MPRLLTRIEPPLWTAEALRDLDGDSWVCAGLLVDGVQADLARAADNRAMVTRMRAAEEARAAVRRAKQGALQQGQRNRDAQAAHRAGGRADGRHTHAISGNWATLWGGYDTTRHAPEKES